MAKPDAVFIYIGTYPSELAARDDYQLIKDLHAVGAVGTYDASVVTKDDNAKVHVNKDEMATRHGAWGGAAVRGTRWHPLSAIDHCHCSRRGRGRRCERPPVARYVPSGRQRVRRHDR